MRIKVFLAFTALVLLLGSSSTAGAAPIVFNNGTPNQSGGSELNSFLEADNFSLGATTNLTLLRFWTLQGDVADYAGSIEWSIRADSGGSPGAVATSGSASPVGVSTGNSAFGLNEFQYEIALSTALGAGNYWVVLHNGPNSTQLFTSFYWSFANDQGGTSMSWDLTTAGPWVGNNAELAFQLEGTTDTTPPPQVPEPATLLLTGAGLAYLARRQKRRV